MGTQLGPTTNPSNYTQEEVDKKLNREREVLEREKTELVEKQCEDPKDSSKTFRPPGVFNVREEVEKYLKSERESWAREKEELEKTAKYASVSAAWRCKKSRDTSCGKHDLQTTVPKPKAYEQTTRERDCADTKRTGASDTGEWGLRKKYGF